MIPSFVSILILGFTFATCGSLVPQSAETAPAQKQDQANSAPVTTKPQRHQPYFQMSAEQRQIFISKVHGIHVGDTR